MSMQDPSEVEKSMDNYADACRKLTEAEQRLDRATKEMEGARAEQQEAWRVVSGHRAAGRIPPGVHRVNGDRARSYQDVIVITGVNDYPPLLPLYRK